MSERAVASSASLPSLAAHMRLKFDKARNSWTVQAPERVFLLDEIAHHIVSRCTGQASAAQIIDSLSAEFADAPRDVIEGDVLRLLQDLADKGVMVL